MKREEFKSLKPGDKVWIVKQKTGILWNDGYEMDKYLGTVMTVENTDHIEMYSFVKMREDDTEWYWYPEMIERKLTEEENQAENVKNKLVEIYDEIEEETLLKGFIEAYEEEWGPMVINIKDVVYFFPDSTDGGTCMRVRYLDDLLQIHETPEEIKHRIKEAQE